MQTPIQRYENAKARGRHPKTPATNALLTWWEHLETVHGVTPAEWGNNTLGWHKKHYPDCITLPSYDEAKQFKQPERSSSK